MRVLSSAIALLVIVHGTTEAANLRGNAVNCGVPPSIFQGTMSYTDTKPGSRVTYKCMKGTYMVGSASATCKDYGAWSNQPPECRIEYLTKYDNSFKNGDKGYKLRSG